MLRKAINKALLLCLHDAVAQDAHMQVFPVYQIVLISLRYDQASLTQAIRLIGWLKPVTNVVFFFLAIYA